MPNLLAQERSAYLRQHQSNPVEWLPWGELVEVAGSGVTVNTIVPGRIAMPRVAQLDQATADREKSDASSVKQKSVQAIPAGRYGDPAEVC